MSLQRQTMIKEIIKDRMRTKFRSYKKPETDNMPFHGHSGVKPNPLGLGGKPAKSLCQEKT